MTRTSAATPLAEMAVHAAPEEALHRVASERRHLGEPAVTIGPIDNTANGELGNYVLTWVNDRLIDLCDLPSYVNPICRKHVFAAPGSLVYLSEETAETYRRSYEQLAQIEEAFLRGEATEAEGSVLVISRLGRAVMCFFVMTLVSTPASAGMPEALIALWPLPQHSAHYPLQAILRYTSPEFAQHETGTQQTGTHQLRGVAIPPGQLRPPPTSPSSLCSTFTCHRGWRVWHPYTPSKAS